MVATFQAAFAAARGHGAATGLTREERNARLNPLEADGRAAGATGPPVRGLAGSGARARR